MVNKEQSDLNFGVLKCYQNEFSQNHNEIESNLHSFLFVDKTA